jgi:phosphonate transport system ATP-binding protein
VSFALAPGERVVLLGRSGAGKTTLLTTVHDRLVGSGRRVALVPQDHGLVPPLSILRNVLMGRLDDHGAFTNMMSLVRPRRADRAEILTILNELGLASEADRAVEGLSGGQKQRTALARALFRGGDVLIGDEPVSAVDGVQATRLLDQVHARFSTSVLALHDVDLARSFATRLIGLRSGAIAFDAAPAQVAAAEFEALYAP